MELEKFLEAEKIVSKKSEITVNYYDLKYIQSKSMFYEKPYLGFSGIDARVKIPDNLLEIILKLIESECVQDMEKLKKELDKL
jgi:hypothetical protein